MIIILGMHRSGTSSLAGSLQERGLYAGKVFESNPHNLKGNRENPDIMNLNEAVLAESEGGWDNPPAKIVWNQEQARERDRIIDYLQRSNAPWGFKDPRTLLTLPFWQDAMLPITYVATFRHPSPVAKSLNKRNGMPLSQGLELWKAYNEILLSNYDRFRFPIVCFDVSSQEYLSSVRRIATYLELDNKDLPAGSTFFDESLRYQVPDEDSRLPNDIEYLYESLIRIFREQAG